MQSDLGVDANYLSYPDVDEDEDNIPIIEYDEDEVTQDAPEARWLAN